MRVSAVLFSILSFFQAGNALACAVCYGDPNSTEAKALTWAVVFLIIVVALVLVGFARFMWHLKKMEDKLYKQPSQLERKVS